MFIAWLELPLIMRERFLGIEAMLAQIYGELNRIRLIQGEKSKRGKKIEEFDKKYNKYYPYFGSKESEKNFKAAKGKYGK